MPLKPQNKKRRWILITVILVLLLLFYLIISRSEFFELLQSGAALKHLILEFGALGPIIVILLIAIAIIISPLPSAPIALASGAVYGHLEGAIYVAIGSEIGAVTAFCIARLAGIDITNNWLGGRLGKAMIGSQNALMAIVFASRLLPFISFDVVSYAAGLTRLTFWRFAIATFAGIIPASFLLAHFGSEMASGDTVSVIIALVLLGLLFLLPIVVKYLRRTPSNHDNNS